MTYSKGSKRAERKMTRNARQERRAMLTKKTIQYFLPEHGQTLEDAFECETTWADEFPHHAVTDCADDYHSEHDEWEASWPLLITVVSNGKTLGTFSVAREARLTFYAIRVS